MLDINDLKMYVQSLKALQWWFVNPDTFVPGRYFRINEFSGLLNHPSDQERKSVPALFVRISEISGLSEPGLTNHHCIVLSNELKRKWWIILPNLNSLVHDIRNIWMFKVLLCQRLCLSILCNFSVKQIQKMSKL